jgi:predicted RNA-binding Zn-ribbon protein involved in translation (DUF1610 family)
MATKFVCVKCGDDNIGRPFYGMQYINQDYFNEIFKFEDWDCQYCGETDIKEIEEE